MCTRVVSTLSHVFEAAGLACCPIVSILPMAEAIAPPRALYAEFPLGRPLGRPGDIAFQRRVLDAAFGLLEVTESPTLVRFGEAIHDTVDDAASCPLPPRIDPDAHPAVDEARGLRPAWERTRDANGGHTQVGRIIGPDQVPEAIAAVAAIADGARWDTVDFGGDPATVLMDIRSYYEEAALALSDHVPAARSVESWYYRTTATGETLARFHAAVTDADPPFPAMFYIRPMSQS